MNLYFTKHAWQKMKYYVDGIDAEISGLGRVTVTNRIPTVHDVEIFEQEVSATHSTLDEDALGKFLYEKTREGANLEEYRLWWHSHNDMDSYFSGTDTGTIDQWSECDWLISTVINNKGEIKARLDTYSPFRLTADLDVKVLEDENEDMRDEIEKEIAEKVKKKVLSYPKSGYGYGGGYGYGYLKRDTTGGHWNGGYLSDHDDAYFTEIEGYPKITGESWHEYWERINEVVDDVGAENESILFPKKKNKKNKKRR